MIILDTDIVSLIQLRRGEVFDVVFSRIATGPAADVCVTIVTFEEQICGWLKPDRACAKPAQQVLAYRRLRRLLDEYRTYVVLEFDEAAAELFISLRKQRLRLGTMDLRIAAIALTKDALLLSRNLADFRQVPGLRVEDWTNPG